MARGRAECRPRLSPDSAELDAPVHGDQRIVFGPHPTEKLTVRNASPAAVDLGIDTVALERCGKVYRKLLVKKSAHQPTA